MFARHAIEPGIDALLAQARGASRPSMRSAAIGSPARPPVARPDLAVLGAELQHELRLQDWDVSYGYARDLRDASGTAVHALCDRLADNKTATILIRDPADPLPAGSVPVSVEAALLTELVRVHLSPLGMSSPRTLLAEDCAATRLGDALARARNSAALLARINATNPAAKAP